MKGITIRKAGAAALAGAMALSCASCALFGANKKEIIEAADFLKKSKGSSRVDNIFDDQNTLIFNIFGKTDKIFHLFGTFSSGVGAHLDTAESAIGNLLSIFLKMKSIKRWNEWPLKLTKNTKTTSLLSFLSSTAP